MTTNQILRDALQDERNWLESQRKAISKGCGSSWDMLQCDERMGLIDAALGATGAAEAPGLILPRFGFDKHDDFCDQHCTWLDHQPGCERYTVPAITRTDMSIPAPAIDTSGERVDSVDAYEHLLTDARENQIIDLGEYLELQKLGPSYFPKPTGKVAP